jgi:hypothetical protein
MGDTPIELIPAAGANNYYDIDKIIVEVIDGGDAYNEPDYLYFGLNSSGLYQGTIDVLILGGAGDVMEISKWNPSTWDSAERVMRNIVMRDDDNLILSTWSGGNLTGGTSTMRVKIYHKTITFGA